MIGCTRLLTLCLAVTFSGTALAGDEDAVAVQGADGVTPGEDLPSEAPPAGSDVDPNPMTQGDTCTIELLDEGHAIKGGTAVVEVTTQAGAFAIPIADDGMLPDAHKGDRMYGGATTADCRGRVKVRLLAKEGAEQPLAAAEGESVGALAGYSVQLLYKRDGSLVVTQSLTDKAPTGAGQTVPIPWAKVLAVLLAAVAFWVGTLVGARRRIPRHLRWLGRSQQLSAFGSELPGTGLTVLRVAPDLRAGVGAALCDELGRTCAVVWASASGSAERGDALPIWTVADPQLGTVRLVRSLRMLAVEGRPAVVVVDGLESVEPDTPGRPGSALAELVWMAPSAVLAVLDEGAHCPVEAAAELVVVAVEGGYRLEPVAVPGAEAGQ